MRTIHDSCFVSLALVVSLLSLLSNPLAVLAGELPVRLENAAKSESPRSPKSIPLGRDDKNHGVVWLTDYGTAVKAAARRRRCSPFSFGRRDACPIATDSRAIR